MEERTRTSDLERENRQQIMDLERELREARDSARHANSLEVGAIMQLFQPLTHPQISELQSKLSSALQEVQSKDHTLRSKEQLVGTLEQQLDDERNRNRSTLDRNDDLIKQLRREKDELHADFMNASRSLDIEKAQAERKVACSTGGF